MKRSIARFCCLVLLLGLAVPARAADPAPAPPFELKDGDRVVMVGGTFMEREMQFGYIETMLTSRFPDRNVTFRNLGYAGDTVGVEARRICSGWAVFGGPDDGFNRLQKLIEEIKPTVVIAAYGMGESFEGEAKLPEFVAKYNRLLDMLTTAGGLPAKDVRVVLIGPNYHEPMPGMPDPTRHNSQLQLYNEAISRIAQARGAKFVDLLSETAPTAVGGTQLTDNGLHLTPVGYYFVASKLPKLLLGEPAPGRGFTHLTPGKIVQAEPETVQDLQGDADRLSFTNRPRMLTSPPIPAGADKLTLTPTLRITDLQQNTGYTLKAGDVEVLKANAAEFGAGVLLNHGPAAEQAEQLRKLIVSKNADYFHYFRPQNDTYILGYRKREQGRNAVEIPQFKPFVEAKEKEIAKLRVPRPVTYTLEKQ